MEIIFQIKLNIDYKNKRIIEATKHYGITFETKTAILLGFYSIINLYSELYISILTFHLINETRIPLY